jgi:predicted amidophosphoribosyltransferase
MLTTLIGLIAPPLCVVCGSDAGRVAPLCRACRAAMRPGSASAVGSACVAMRPGAGGAPSSAPWAAFAYEGPAGALVRELKFRGRTRLADLMAAQIAANAPPELLGGAVVPVPVHPRHRRRRGVDHSRALAVALARRTALPLCDCLVRQGDPRPQVGRGRRARMSGPLGSITVRDGAAAPLRALLVDDVITTGATLAACASALKAAGTAEITPIAYARTTAR